MATIQQLYAMLRKAGLTRAASLAFLGNWQIESGCEPNRLQGDFDSFRHLSKDYTSRVMNGSISRQQFGSDQKGYGLAQWTYVNYPQNTKGRKFDLYDFWKASGKAIDDAQLQVDFAMWEMKRDFKQLLAFLQTTDDLYKATNDICYQFENPARKNVQDRYQAAQQIGQMVQDDAQVEEPEQQEQPKQPTVLDLSVKTGKGLAQYAIAQLGKPYWWGTFGQTATNALLMAKRQQYPDYYQASDFPSQFGQKVHDCVGLIKGYRWCDTPNSEPKYVGSQDVAVNGLYIQCGRKGTLNSMPDIPGICVFQADMSHVGVYIGNNFVVEAMGHAYGVIKTQLYNRNWALWGMPSWISYENNTESTAVDQSVQTPEPEQQFPTMRADLPLLKKGDKGIPVKKLQHLLLLENACKPIIENSGGIDGDFGSSTKRAVIVYQNSKGLEADGEVGSQTWISLLTT